LCMPYFGGATLARVLEALEPIAASDRTGSDVLRALDEVEMSMPVQLPSKGPARAFLARANGVEAMCWVGACLADALHYAHERGLVPLELKPSNVLLAADGQPMLLDFHLAQPPLVPDGPPVEWMGGTDAFMAPEQADALQAIRNAQPIPRRVDQRA